jgi:flagellar protein FliL
MKKIVAILGIVLLSALAAVGGVTIAIGSDRVLSMVGLGGDDPAPEAEDADGHETTEDGHGKDSDGHGEAKVTEEEMPVMPFPEIIVNVTDTGMNGNQSSRFLKLNMLLVYDDKLDGADRLLAREVYLRDTFQDFLRQLHVSDLKGSHGLAMMKTELLRRARAIGHTEAPLEILIADMVVQ